MNHAPPRPTRLYLAVTWLVAVVVGAGIGLLLGAMLATAWVGIVVGAAVALLIGVSSTLAARRSGGGTIEAAPPWTGDAGIRHHSGGSI